MKFVDDDDDADVEMAGRIFDMETGRIRQHQHHPNPGDCIVDAGFGHFKLVSLPVFNQ